jgi:hypothetical protein
LGVSQPSIVADFRRLARHAALVGFALALLCHLVPHDYRAVCRALATLCSSVAGGH